ncbi:MAG: PDZ domain-containing protein [Acidobacteriota bacterium]
MNSFSKIAAAALLAALPLPTAARAGDDAPSRVRVRDDGDTVEVEAVRPRVGLRRLESRAAIGIALIDITPELRSHFGAPRDAGAMIGEVGKDSPAARAGLEVGDVVTSVDGERVASGSDLARAVRRREIGGTVKLEVVRNKAARTVSVPVEASPRRDTDLAMPELGDFGRDMGRMGRDLGREIRREMRSRPFHFDFDTQALAVPPRDDVRRLRERVEDLEKRLKDLEGRRGR